MEIMEIIKEAIVFPSNDLAKLAIYIVLSVIIAFLTTIGVVFLTIGVASDAVWMVIGIILLILGLIVGFIIMGYQISIIKTGIDHAEAAPEFVWKANLITGIKYFVVNIVYFIIPAIIVLIVAWATNLFGSAYEVLSKMAMASASPTNATVAASNVVPQSVTMGFLTSLMITGAIAFVLFVIFEIIQTMAESRLANTDDLKEALNIPEAFRDIGRIGFGKVIAVIILIVVVIAVINAILNGLNDFINGISILSIVVTPYLTFFAARATGLLYSDIA